MAVNVIPITVPADAPYSEMPLTLLGITYTFTMRYNYRSGAWTSDWQDYSGNLLAAGIPLKTGRNSIAPLLNVAGLPYGALVAVDTSGANSDPGLNSFQSTHQLLFLYRA